MPQRINWPTLLAGLFLAGISLTFAATGLVHLFAGAGVSIVIMAIAFEVAKVGTTIYLIQNFRWRFVPLALTFALLCLVVISSLGIYGYLGRAYAEGRADAVVGAGTITIVQQQLTDLERDRDRLWEQINAVPVEYATARRRMMESMQPQIEGTEATIGAKRAELLALQTEQIGKENSIGELKYAAELIGTTEEGIAAFIITTLAFLLDPLAVLLILASGVKGRREEVSVDEDVDTEEDENAYVEHTYHPDGMWRYRREWYAPPEENADDDEEASSGEEGGHMEPEVEEQIEQLLIETEVPYTPVERLSPALNRALHARKSGKESHVVANADRRQRPPP